jgi:hypothetical protein
MNRRGWLLALAAVALSAQTGASVSGKWHCVLETQDGERIIEPVFHQDGEKVTGKWRDGDVKGTFSGGKLDVEFPVNSEEAGAGILKLKGEFSGDALAGEWSFQEYKGSFRATRIQSGGSPGPNESHPHP